jgi:hypothetical protein
VAIENDRADQSDGRCFELGECNLQRDLSVTFSISCAVSLHHAANHRGNYQIA